MLKKKIILTCAAFSFSGILVNELIFSSKQTFNYCRETRQTQKELLDLESRSEKPSLKNIKYPIPLEYSSDNIIFAGFQHVLYVVCLHNLSSLKSSAARVLSQRAPPVNSL